MSVSTACAQSEEATASFTGAGSLSAGNSATASAGSTGSTGDSESASASASASASNSGGSNSASASGTTTNDPTDPTGDSSSTGMTTDETSGTTGGLDCDDGLGNLCGNPYDLGMVMEGGGAMSEVRTITTPGVADWYQVSFTATGRPGGGTPTVTFAANDDGAYVFDAYTQPPCGAPPATCGQGGENGAASKITEYTFVDDQPDCCAPPDDSMVPWPGVLYLRVYRVDAGQTCATYQLALSR
ncbi:MAG: hypothetical protein KC420_04570 [Myxococcales bacterium]|nr:hypothetical protein [Myxococcales bacterium]